MIVPQSWDELGRAIGAFVAVGASKFVVVPLVEPGTAEEWVAHLEQAAAVLQPLQT